MVSKRRQYFCWCDDLPYRLFSVDQVQILLHCKYTNNFQYYTIFNPILFTFIEIKSYLHCFKTNRTASSIKNHPFSPFADHFHYSCSFPASTLSSLYSNAFTEINISFTEIPNEITNSNKAIPNV